MKLKQTAALLLGCLLLTSCGSKPAESTAVIPAETTASAEAVPAMAPVTETTAPPVLLRAEDVKAMPAGTILDAAQLTPETVDALFCAEPIDDAVFARINGVSYQENPYITRDDLRYLRVLHITPATEICIGEMICNQLIAEDLLDIFKRLYEAQYQIEKIRLIDEYGGDDEASMADNNTSCFNYREIAGSATISNHAKGLAVDINPLYNPYISNYPDGSKNIQPREGLPYADRSSFFPMKITDQDLCFELFTLHGFAWGGNWDTPLDYQHFEKPM